MNEEPIAGFPEAVVALIEKVAAPDQVGDNDPISPATGCAGEDAEDGNEVWEDALENIGS